MMEVRLEDLEKDLATIESKKAAFIALVDTGASYEEARVGYQPATLHEGMATDFIEIMERATGRSLPR